MAAIPVTNAVGKVRVIVPVAARLVAVVKDTVHTCPDPWPRRPVSATLDTQLVHGVLTDAMVVSDEVLTFKPFASMNAPTPPTVRPLHVTVTRPDAKALPTVIVIWLDE